MARIIGAPQEINTRNTVSPGGIMRRGPGLVPGPRPGEHRIEDIGDLE
jgi:hypothetical protein